MSEQLRQQFIADHSSGEFVDDALTFEWDAKQNNFAQALTRVWWKSYQKGWKAAQQAAVPLELLELVHANLQVANSSFVGIKEQLNVNGSFATGYGYLLKAGKVIEDFYTNPDAKQPKVIFMDCDSPGDELEQETVENIQKVLTGKYVVAPAEPTEAMISHCNKEAFRTGLSRAHTHEHIFAYKTMLESLRSERWKP